MICAKTTTTTATMTNASIIVGFGYDDPYEFSFSMTHCPFDLADIPDEMTKYFSCLLFMEGYKKHPLLFLQCYVSLGFQNAYTFITFSLSAIMTTSIRNPSSPNAAASDFDVCALRTPSIP